MPVAPNHSHNLPREFERCPNPDCGKKGLYRYGGTVLRNTAGVLGGLSPGRRCKYCRHRVPDMSQDDYDAYLNRPAPVAVAPSQFAPERHPNGMFRALTVGVASDHPVMIEREGLVELARLLAHDPTLCRLPERKFMHMQEP